MDPLAAFTPETFRPLIGERLGGLELVSVTDLGGSGREGGAFTLLLRGPADAALEQGTVVLQHPALGEFALFVVPVAAGPGTRDYEAVFA